MRKKFVITLLALLVAGPASASIIRVTESAFTFGSGLITFGEFAVDTANPVYAPGSYGGSAGDPTVTFDGFFTGQGLSASPATDCPGGAATACVVGTPTGPLSLDPASPDAFITTDTSNPTSPVLSGSPKFNGPIAALFDIDVAGVGFDGGFFDDVGSTGITAFARDGSTLGTVSNLGTGIEFLGLATADGTNQIAGFFLDLVGAEDFGFAVDNIRFGTVGQIAPPPTAGVPAPLTLALFGLGLAGLGWSRRKQA